MHTACLIKQKIALEDILTKTRELLTTMALESETILERQNGNMQKHMTLID